MNSLLLHQSHLLQILISHIISVIDLILFPLHKLKGEIGRTLVNFTPAFKYSKLISVEKKEQK